MREFPPLDSASRKSPGGEPVFELATGLDRHNLPFQWGESACRESPNVDKVEIEGPQAIDDQ
jgi:hypothetical protein